MKHTKKRVAALLLALAMVLSLMPAAFAADTDFPDMPAEDDPSYAAVKSAVDNEIMTGQDGLLNLEGTILRSTVSKMVVTAFAAKGEADLSAYADVVAGAWYEEWMAKANQMGIMSGTSGKMRPSDEVTLQEVAAMLVRALGLEPGDAADLEGIPGADSVAAWAIPWVAALVKANYISDVTGANQPMTRAAFAEVIYKVSGEGNYVKEAGEYTEDVDGNIVITADGVSLKGITVKGDVIIADGVDAGSINLDGVKIEGRLVVRGGAEASLTNGTTASATIVAKSSGEITVKADNSSDAGKIDVAGTQSKAPEKVTLDMAEPNATISTDTAVAVQNAKGGEITMASANVSLTVESGKLDNVIVSDGMNEVKVEVAAGATIENLTTNTDLTVTGEGTVSEVTGSGVVSDEAGEVIGGGDDEPAVVPTVVSGGSTASEEGPAAPAQTAHVHNYAAPSDGSATQLNATHHLVACVNKAAVTADPDADPPVVGQPAIVGCGAVVAMPHTPDEDGVCTACGYAKQTVTTSAVTKGEEDLCANGAHTWVADEDETDTVATCEDDGVKHEKCEDCGATRTITTTAKGHNYLLSTGKTKTYAATCAADGKQTYECQNEGCTAAPKVVTIKKESVAHTLVRDTTQDQAGTCKVAGVEGWKCSVCDTGANKTLEIDPNAHTWGAWSSATADGVTTHTRSCTGASCTAKQTHAPAAAASWSSNDTNHWHICTVAGCTQKVGDAAHSYGTEENPSKTCTSCGKPKPADPEPCENEANHGDLHKGEKCGKCDTIGTKDHTFKDGSCTRTSCDATCTTENCPNVANHKPGDVKKGETACSQCGLKGTKEETTQGQT
ncbi:MAG: S-layer homology domain-containing protein [Oscillospiraceae bacterium]|nr:S-layer homology domain-containing protein [Oscillospiraceae bacterium]